MMTTKEVFMATLNGEKADRYVNQYEYMGLLVDPVMLGVGGFAITMKPGDHEISGWGVEVEFVPGHPGPMPVLNDDTLVIKDIEDWKECVKAPEVVYSDEAWQPCIDAIKEMDRDNQFVTAFTGPGLFEKVHYLCGFENALMYLISDPEPMHDLIDFVKDWELKLAEQQIKHLHPEVLFHHDDFGGQKSSIMSPEMFKEFIVPAYKEIYGYYRDNGVIIVHHSDSYAANLVPDMIDMGVQVWQGCMSTNNIPELIKNYGDKLCFMGGIDSGKVDRPDWTPELVRNVVETTCRENGTKHFIPCHIMGGPDSVHPGVYDTITKEVDRMSKIMF